LAIASEGLVAEVPPRAHHLMRPASGLGDRIFLTLSFLGALAVPVIVALIAVQLVDRSSLAIHQFGWSFLHKSTWDPVAGDFGALPFIYGTVVSSLLALAMATPVALGLAVFLTEFCPPLVRKVLGFATDLLAAIPSVIYGLWGIFVLVPLMRNVVQPFLVKTLGFTGLFGGPSYGIGMFTAALILAIMVVPLISSIAREVLVTVPREQREAVLALGATKWEMVRVAVIRNSWRGIWGGVFLGLGRALGETMAVTMVIGNRPEVAKNLLAPAYTLSSVIANEFSEASDDLYLSALAEIALVLFAVSIVVNVIARLMVRGVVRNA
jgi:phosphate transport system permease protein